MDIQQDPVQVYVVDGLWEEADNPPQTLNVNKHELEVQFKAFLVDSRFGTNIRFPYFHDQLWDHGGTSCRDQCVLKQHQQSTAKGREGKK